MCQIVEGHNIIINYTSKKWGAREALFTNLQKSGDAQAPLPLPPVLPPLKMYSKAVKERKIIFICLNCVITGLSITIILILKTLGESKHASIIVALANNVFSSLLCLAFLLHCAAWTRSIVL